MIIPSEYGSAAFKFQNSANDEVCLFTIGFFNSDGETAESCAAILDTVFLGAFDDSEWNDEWTYLGVYVLINFAGVMFSAETTSNVVGTETSDSPSPAVAVGVKKTTSMAGKAYRGRLYLPSCFLFEPNISSAGVIDNSLVVTLQDSCDDMLAGMSAGTLPGYLLHNDPLIDPSPITGLIVRSSVRTQRRRQKLGA